MMNAASTSFDEWAVVHFGDVSLKLIRIARLKQLQADRKLSGPVELGQLINRKVNQVSDLLNGRAPFGEKIARSIEEAADLPPGWLDEPTEDGKVTSIQSAAAKRSRELVITQYRTGGAMGHGLVLRDQPGVINSWHVTPEWIQKNVPSTVSNPRNLAIVTGFGDSMRPLFNPGDPLLVDTGVKTVDFDGIYFFRIGDEGFIKRLQRVPGEGLIAISENKAYKDWVVRDGMDFEVFARVVKVWRGDEF